MANHQQKQTLETIQHPQLPRANSEPLLESEQTTVMGRSYRTPSPIRGESFLTDVSPGMDSRDAAASRFIEVPRTPTSDHCFIFPSPTTPRTLVGPYGLLTPSTPRFNKAFLDSPVFQKSAYVDDNDSYAVARVLSYDNAATMRDGVNTINFNVDAQDSQDQALSMQHLRTKISVVEPVENEDNWPPHTQYEKLQQQVRNTELAARCTEDKNVSVTRRSIRLACKDTVKDVDTQAHIPQAKTNKAPKQIPTSPPASPPKSSLSEEAVVQLPPDASPAILTLDWQLQYPPGGSTHPSYAYPQMDPRLLFNPSLVPIIDGLPNVLALPPLVLPMGWNHISWSGFLPIVFDPYHQGFKLTPIGPLPLTCEEVQQGGLAKFVPGGECHPEAGLLPDCAGFTDGSEEVKYNFDDVDWVLPWPQSETFDRCSSVATAVLYADNSPVRHRELSTPHNLPYSLYFEARDCPDDIVDLEDAWRWLAQKETDPDLAFVPSPTKTWHGTGIHRSGRRFKVPIASLMGLAIRDTIVAPDDPLAAYLLSQNTREFCPFRSMATPVFVNIAILGNVEFTLKELLSYFPSHYMWPKGAERLIRSGMSTSDISNMINMVRQLSGDTAKVRSSIGSSMKSAVGKASDENSIYSDIQTSELHDYTAQAWTYDYPEMVDYPVLGLTHGLAELPQGVDAGPLTQLIAWCRKEGKHDVLLSQVSDMLQGAGISSMIGPGEGGCPDKEVAGRHAVALIKDRKRVLKIAKAKRMLDDADEKKEKKDKRVRTE